MKYLTQQQFEAFTQSCQLAKATNISTVRIEIIGKDCDISLTFHHDNDDGPKYIVNTVDRSGSTVADMLTDEEFTDYVQAFVQ